MEDDVTEKIAGNVRAALAYRDISGKTAAAHIGMNQNQFSRRYNGNTAWKANEIDALAQLVDVTVTALVRGDGLREPQPPVVEELAKEVDAAADEDAERRRALLDERVEELLELTGRLAGDLDRTRVALQYIRRELGEL